MRKSTLAVLGLGALTALGFAVAQGKSPVIGLITKTETNPFFVKMKEGAQKQADASGAKFLSAAGKIDGDNAGQVTAIENMVAAGAQTILITPSDSKAIVPAIAKARAAGVIVIALDSPTEPAEAVDALFATNNYKAGILIGEYAASALKGKKVKIAMLDLFPGHPVGIARHNGFLDGFGVAGVTPDTEDLATRTTSCLRRRHLRRPSQRSNRHGKLPPKGPRHQLGVHHQRTSRRRCITKRSKPLVKKKASQSFQLTVAVLAFATLMLV